MLNQGSTTQTGETKRPVKTSPVRLRSRPIDFAGVRVHMIGIGGCGMAGAARLLLQCGADVTGSDRSPFRGLGDLVESGACVHIGQRAANISAEVDLVVTSAAVPDDNIEIVTAQAAGCRVIKYAELLGELMRLRTGVAIAGTHGKSTTTALCTHLFRTAGLDPSFVIGAEAPQLGGASGVGMGEHFIVEACEFDRSFLHHRPQSAAILNIEADHLDCYTDLDDIIEAFSEFASHVPAHGLVITRSEDENAARAVKDVPVRVETFGFDESANWRGTNLSLDQGRYAFNVSYDGVSLLRASLCVAGRHNVANALAATALAWNAGASREAIAEGLSSFAGVERRMSLRGRYNGITIVDDYAHHPTEVRVTLRALRECYAPRRLWVVFQPHQHSRTRLFLEEFARSFGDADEVIVPRIYRSRDSKHEIAQTQGHTLVRRIQANGVSVSWIPELGDVAEVLQRRCRSGDLVVTMGAGDVWKLCDDLVERLQS